MFNLWPDIEDPFHFSERLTYAEAFLQLSPVDRACLVGILVRDRYARKIGVVIPIDKLLGKLPI